MRKSSITKEQTFQLNPLGRSYYLFCLENALTNIQQARALVKDDFIDDDHELPKIESLIQQAYDAG